MAAVATAWPKIDYTDERLDNGLRLIMSEDHLAPIACVNIWYNVGSRHEEKGKTGLAHLFEHVMFEGSANVGKGEHFKLINKAGGTLNGSTWYHRTNYFEWAPSNQLELMLWLEADRMGSLLDAVNQEALDNQRDVVKNERRWTIDNPPYGTWKERMSEAVFPEGHPYHHDTLGYMEDLTAASLDDVKNFFRTYYAPNNAVLSVVGDFDPQQLREWVNEYFGPIPRGPEIPKAHPAKIELGGWGEFREQVSDLVPLPRVFVGFRAPPDGSRESDALTMATALLMLGNGSRLHRRLVRKGIAQDAQLFSQGFPEVSFGLGWATSRPDTKIEDVETAFLEIIDGVATEEITDDEMTRARAQVERLVIGHLMTVAERADWLSEHATLFDDPGKVNERLPSLLSITPEEIKKVAAEVLRPDNRAVITFVPGEKEVKE